LNRTLAWVVTDPIDPRLGDGFGDAQGAKMKIGSLAGLSLIAAAFLAGCAGFWDPPSSTSATTTPTTLSSGVFYVLNQTTKQIAAYSIASGKLQTISGSPYALSATPYCIAVAPGGGFLYVGTVNGIYLYTISSTGSLTLENGGSTISADIAQAMQVSGPWLVDAFTTASGAVQMDAIAINSTTGAYAGGGGTPPNQTFNVTNAAVKQMVLSPDGKNLFVALGSGGTMVVPFTSGNANPLAATATTIGVQNSGGAALSVAVDPTNRLFYIGETLANSAANSGGLRVFNYSSLSSTLTQISGSPIASGGLAPNAILPIASGDYVYVANGQGQTVAGNIAWFPITASGTTYTVAAGSSIASGVQPASLAEDSEDNFVLTGSTGGSTSSGSPDLDAYTMSSGTLTSALTSSTGTDPVGAIAIAPLP
jgi:6-phosphogluconolactonase (cycloisomerase 2 family)